MFIVFDNDNSEVPYRIPAIAKNKAGDLIALADYRYSHADIGMAENGKLDLRYRIKDFNTGEWGEIMTLAAAFGEGDENIAFGDPCIVADKDSDRILVTSCSGNVSFPKGTPENHQGWARFYSDDGGKTWSTFEDISSQVFEKLEGVSGGPVNCFFIGAGKITQSPTVKVGDYGRLYCAALMKMGNKVKSNYVLYSDDFGENWNILGDIEDIPVPAGADEAKTEELPDGSVLVSSRIKGGRFFNIFHYSDVEKGEGKWDKVAVSDSTVNGLTASANACNGEVLVVPVKSLQDGRNSYLLLQSVPFGPDKRDNVGINYKVLDTLDDYSTPENLSKDWDGRFQVSDMSSAYSTMILDANNNIAFLYEENARNDGYNIVYKSFTLPEITDNKYRYYNEE